MPIKLAGTRFALNDEFSATPTGLVSLRSPVSVKAKGAIGDGSADDTDAINAAIAEVAALGRGVVRFPAGTYKFTSQLLIASDNVVLEGDGIGVTFLYPTMSSGDCIYFYKSGGTLQRVGMRNISVYGLATDATSGALVRVRDANTLAEWSNVELAGYFGALHLESVVHGTFHGLDLKGDANMTSRKTDSYLLKITQSSGGAIPGELHFYGSEWRGQAGNNYLDYAVLIQAGDGIWFNGGHMGFCGQAAMRLNPQSVTTQLTGINTRNVYLDTVDPTNATNGCGLDLTEPTSYTGVFGAHSFDFAQIYNCRVAVRLNCAQTDPSNIRIAQAFYLQSNVVRLIKGSYWRVDVDHCYDFNIGNVSGCGIYVSGSGTDYDFYVSAKKTTSATPYAAIWLDGTIDRVLIRGLVAKDCTYDVLRATTVGTNIAVGPVVTNRSTSISADGGGALEPEIGTDTWALGTANAVGAISARHAYKGRMITLVATGSVTVNDANNLKIAGTYNMTADDALTLRCDGTNWFEVARSVN
jgi:hypothetical protein